ncbi:phosphoribosylamine--glycine ligase [Roseicella aquatilis]|nr:phosphoribosylamine--glycine ligase [Roseicella aquatilis]
MGCFVRPTLPLAALLLLGGCSLFRASTAPVPETPEQRLCRQEASRSPAVLELNRERNAMNQINDLRLDRERDQRFARAFQDCMRARGFGPPGGVEPLIPR